MAYVDSKDVLISVDLGTEGDPDWRKVACSTSDGLDMETDSVSISTKCNGGFATPHPGDLSWSFSNSSYVDKDKQGDAGFLDHDDLFDIWKDKEIRNWKIESLDNDFTYIRIGEGFISSLGDSADQGDYLQFSLTVTGVGELKKSAS